VATTAPRVSSDTTATPRPSADGPSSSRVLELDGFRAAAVLMVLIMHLFYGWPTPALSWLPGFVRGLIGHGWLGVDLFFILFGFLITGILIDSRESEHYFRNFYTRRVLRIVPLYLTCILIMYFGYPAREPTLDYPCCTWPILPTFFM
jgi:peptidoglycan/LPS O-acetylase OafA/YrhL